MKKTTMRVLSVLLSVLLVVSLAPLSVLAEGTGVAKIGDAEYETLSKAIDAAVDGDTIVITTEGPHKLKGFDKKVTVASAEGIEAKIDMSSAVGLHNSTKTITFEEITFVYGNANYVGLQHAGNLVYNNCTINGQVFLYGTSEIFNNCTFNQDKADAYNVWTYGADHVEFNDCTFNCVGKSVLVYNEGAGGTDLSVENTTFNASAPVEGKSAIEIDSSLLPAGQIFNIDVDKTSTATGFDAGSVSGNTLWNNKKGEDAMVEVNNETVLVPTTTTYVAYIGGQGYETVPAALAAATAGQTVQVMAGTYTASSWSVKSGVSLVGVGDVVLNGKLSASGSDIYVANIDVYNPGDKALGFSGSGMFENCSFVGYHGVRYAYASGLVTFKDCVVTGVVYGIHFDGSAGGKVVIDGCTITGWTSFAGTVSEIKMKDTSFEEGNYNYVRFYQDAVIEGCTFNKDMTIDVAGDVEENSVTITESVVEGGAPIESLFSASDLESSVVAGVAKVNGINYKTLADAFAAAKAGETVTLISDITGAGFEINKSITIDFNGYTYTVTAPVAGGDGIVIKSGLNVTLKNGSITAASGSIYALIQNSAKLTVQDMNLRGLDTTKFVLSNNICKVQILGNTNIYAANVAFDVYAYCTVTLNTTGLISGNIQVSGKNASLTVENGNFTVAPKAEWLAEESILTEKANGTYLVKKAVGIVGANMTLGSSLNVNFYVNKADLKGIDFYAIITETAADGTVKTVKVPFAAWTAKGDLYKITFEGVAAKEMADAFTIQIFDSNTDVAVSKLHEDSVRDYAMRVLAKAETTAKEKTLIVDMLNYGAAAQKFFNYNTENLANALLSDEQKGFATAEVTAEDKRVKGEKYVGSMLKLENTVQLVLVFEGLTEDMVAMVTYEGQSEPMILDSSKFVYNNSNGQVAIVIDTLEPADASKVVTCKIVAGGEVISTVSDSIESYIARVNNGAGANELYDAILKFAASAAANQ